jgi:hypothetical protein
MFRQTLLSPFLFFGGIITKNQAISANFLSETKKQLGRRSGPGEKSDLKGQM